MIFNFKPRLFSTVIYSILLFNINTCFAEPFSVALNDYYLEGWTTREGLPHNSINDIVQTSDGYLWLATWEGVARFNGKEFRVFDEQDTQVLEDSGVVSLSTRCGNNGELLVSDALGRISKYHNLQWSIHHQLESFARVIMCDSNDNIWIGLEKGGVGIISQNGNYKEFDLPSGLAGGTVYSMATDRHGVVWVGTVKGAYKISKNGSIESVYEAAGVPSRPTFSLAQSPSGNMYMGTDKGIYVYENDNIFEVESHLSRVTVSELIFDRTGGLWIGTINNGLFRLRGMTLEKYTASKLLNNRVISLFEDMEGNIFVGTNGGLMKFRRTPFSTFNYERGLKSDYVRTLLETDDGSLYVGSSRGIDIIRDNKVFPVPFTSEITNKSVLSMAATEKGDFWVGSYTDGLTLFRNNKFELNLKRADGLAADEVRSILPVGNKLYVGTSSGLSIVSGKQILNLTKENGLSSNYITSLHYALDKNIWIGTSDGISVLTDSGITNINLDKFPDIHFIFGFHERTASQGIWIATDGGILFYNIETEEILRADRQAGIPFDKFFAIEEDKLGYFWLSGNRGILRVAKDDLMSFMQGNIEKLPYRLFGESDGLVSVQANGGSGTPVVLKSDGSIWFSMSKGVSRVYPDNTDFSHPQPPQTVIENIMLNGESIQPESNIVLPPGRNRIEIHFAGLGLSTPENIRFATFMEGVDEEWIYLDKRSFREFTNLAAGQYRFHVVAGYGSFPMSEFTNGVTLSFKIAPYFWETKLFYMLACTSIISLLILAMELRTRNVRNIRESLKKRVAAQTYELQCKTERLELADCEKNKLLSEIKAQAEKYEKLALEDPLTGVFNRRAFNHFIECEISKVKEVDGCFSILVIDIDNFKQINDNYSHTVGDKVLKRVAGFMQTQCRNDDIVARWGGEEFVILLKNSGSKRAANFAERIRQLISELDFSDVDERFFVTVSIGVSEYHTAYNDELLFKLADEALYRAKNNGKNNVQCAMFNVRSNVNNNLFVAYAQF